VQVECRIVAGCLQLSGLVSSSPTVWPVCDFAHLRGASQCSLHAAYCSERMIDLRCAVATAVVLQPENFAKKGLRLPRPVRAWPPRENGKFDSIGQLPPVKQVQQQLQQCAV
jgi:hypothetical protein